MTYRIRTARSASFVLIAAALLGGCYGLPAGTDDGSQSITGSRPGVCVPRRLAPGTTDVCVMFPDRCPTPRARTAARVASGYLRILAPVRALQRGRVNAATAQAQVHDAAVAVFAELRLPSPRAQSATARIDMAVRASTSRVQGRTVTVPQVARAVSEVYLPALRDSLDANVRDTADDAEPLASESSGGGGTVTTTTGAHWSIKFEAFGIEIEIGEEQTVVTTEPLDDDSDDSDDSDTDPGGSCDDDGGCTCPDDVP